MTIKKLKITDIGLMVPLFDEYMIFYGKSSAPEKYQDYLCERIENNEATVFLAYDERQSAIGFALNYISFSSVSLGKIIVLNDLYVTEESRNTGIGKKLIERTFKLAKEAGAVRVDLGTAKENLTAQGLYEKVGFLRDTEFYAYSYSISSQSDLSKK